MKTVNLPYRQQIRKLCSLLVDGISCFSPSEKLFRFQIQLTALLRSNIEKPIGSQSSRGIWGDRAEAIILT